MKILLLSGGKDGGARGLMLLLSSLEDLIEIDSLLIIGGLLKLTLCLLSILLVNLLLNPLFLLLLLQLHSLFLHYIIFS